MEEPSSITLRLCRPLLRTISFDFRTSIEDRNHALRLEVSLGCLSTSWEGSSLSTFTNFLRLIKPTVSN
jgi:hypothetical protein